ncbi:MAG: FtsQ-type POTRA domain-containing protein [Candidatus Nealsonbacteria bacterium]|nr:FtsQ-type POTRA domain-containing protein [Candidatus Nealsonbacteria bacterium]
MKTKKKNFRKSHRKKLVKPFYKKKLFLLPAGISFLFISLAYFFLFFDYFWINNIKIEGNEVLSREAILGPIEEKLSTKILFFRSSSIFLFNSNQMSKDILEAFPLIKDVQIKKDLPDKITINIKERQPVAFWCNSECYLVDSVGVAFRERRDDDKRRVIIRSQGDFQLGEQVVDINDMQRIIKIWKRIGENLGLIEFEVGNQKLNAKTSENWYIYFNSKEDLSTQILKLELVLEEKISPAKRKKLEYIDLRFDSRVYFK